MLLFGAPWIGQEEIDEVVATLKSGWIGQGPRVAEFEERFREAVGAEHAVAVSSCTAALHLSLLAAGIGPGDEVLVPVLTFTATAAAVEYTGATPLFFDVEPTTLNVDLGDCERRITERTRAIVITHFGGLPCPMEAVQDFAQAHGLVVVEDAAHALGASYDGAPVGSFATFSCFSFYANKNITTGEGGMIALADGSVAERLRKLRLHGLSVDAWERYGTQVYRPSFVEMLGFKSNLTDLQAALGLPQLRKLAHFQERREAIARLYDEALAPLCALGFQARTLPGHTVRHALHLYAVLLEEEVWSAPRDQVIAGLRAENIGAAVHYRALHLEPYYINRFGHPPEAFPVAADISSRILTLPLSASMEETDAHDVISAMRKVWARYQRPSGPLPD